MFSLDGLLLVSTIEPLKIGRVLDLNITILDDDQEQVLNQTDGQEDEKIEKNLSH